MATQTLKNWHKVRLDEIANFEYGYTASAKENDTGTKLLRITDIVPDLIDWNTVPFCEIDEKGVRQFEIKKGDILIARTGATAGYAKLIRRQPQKSVFASYLIRVRMKKADVSPEYVGRIVESEMFKQFVTIHAGGSAQPHANAPVLKNFELFLPDAKTQTEIVDVLSAYDDLIENNTRRIQILEQLAQAIYTEWFVNFRFPGHEKEKMIDSDTDFGKIPEGWEVAKVGDIAEFMNGYAFKPRHLGMIGLPVIKIPELRSGVLSKTPRNSGESIPKKYFIKNGDILFSWSATLLVNIWNSGEGLRRNYAALKERCCNKCKCSIT
ncbi:MAG: Type I restriction-modification system, specificity subunit S [candidate division CPR1 bacterium GW2011_GWA2_42_17]|uniref:Type I restriction-modification system, specificity subunit S n=1 Tax=candidate division CPR1 bacterium GW2011_GWA2_42_17 TaxID=1618341 RepID=A0A0G0YXH8_9BACT|nr:MAG: Type I restriction-modification system, specificity subunit S [candidate division CPR1 bacterium GW2011_GWA2_42_17]